MAANVMSLQMALAEQTFTSTAQAQHDEMPCHHMADEHQGMHHSADDQTAGDHAPGDQTSSKHHCTVCGFCMVTTGVAHLDAFPTVSLIAQSSVAPLFAVDPVHSQTYPPAIKPPIFG